MSDYRLSNLEKETIIIFNEAEDNAECYTCNGRLMKRLDDLTETNELVKKIKEDDVSKTYTFPKKFVKINPSRVLSREEKERLSLKMKEVRKLSPTVKKHEQNT